MAPTISRVCDDSVFPEAPAPIVLHLIATSLRTCIPPIPYPLLCSSLPQTLPHANPDLYVQDSELSPLTPLNDDQGDVDVDLADLDKEFNPPFGHFAPVAKEGGKKIPAETVRVIATTRTIPRPVGARLGEAQLEGRLPCNERIKRRFKEEVQAEIFTRLDHRICFTSQSKEVVAAVITDMNLKFPFLLEFTDDWLLKAFLVNGLQRSSAKSTKTDKQQECIDTRKLITDGINTFTSRMKK